MDVNVYVDVRTSLRFGRDTAWRAALAAEVSPLLDMIITASRVADRAGRQTDAGWLAGWLSSASSSTLFYRSGRHLHQVHACVCVRLLRSVNVFPPVTPRPPQFRPWHCVDPPAAYSILHSGQSAA